jgi:hypothetical protein
MFSGRSLMDELKLQAKPFEMSKREVWESWCEVRANKGAPGVDGQSIEEFEKDLKNDLYKIWNWMSFGEASPAAGARGGDRQAARKGHKDAGHSLCG